MRALRRRATRLLGKARQRAKQHDLPIDLTLDDVETLLHNTSGRCPVFGVTFDPSHPRWSASLDRIIPDRGYRNGNVIVVSSKANGIKSDATLEEIYQVYSYYFDLEVTA